jgi:hypothetical protein
MGNTIAYPVSNPDYVESNVDESKAFNCLVSHANA